jgi:hypothetical protein
MTPTTIRLTRDGTHYTYACEFFTATIWKYQSAYGDIQWGCDIRYPEGHHGVDLTYGQFDTLGGARNWVAHLSKTAKEETV